MAQKAHCPEHNTDGTFSYVACKQPEGFLCPSTGWSLDALQEWGSFMKLGIPSALMMCIEGTVYDLGAILSGKLQNSTDLMLTPILTQTKCVFWCFLADSDDQEC